MDYNEFSEKIKAKYPQYQDIDNKELAQKMIAKYPEYKEQVSFDIETPQTQQQPKGIDLTPAGIINNVSGAVSDAILTPVEMIKNKEKDVKKAYSSVAKKRKEFEKEYKKQAPILSGARDLGLDLLGYSMLPVDKGSGIANFAKNAVVQGGVPMALESLKRGGNVLGGLASGSLLGAGIQSLPYVGKVVSKPAKYLSSKAVKAVTGLKPKTLKRLVQADSKALELTEDTAQNLLTDTTENVRKNYNSLLTDKGNIVGNLLEKLPTDRTFKAGDILADYDKIYNNYSLSKNPLLNPARNATTRELGKIEDLVYGDTSGNLQNFKKSIDELKYPNGKLETITNRYKNQYYKKQTGGIGNDITIANRRFNDEILGNLKEHPEWVNDPSKIEALEKQISSYHVPEDYLAGMYNKFYEALGKGDILNKANNKVTPKELYDINKNVSNMVDWNKPDSVMKNDVLEQIYGMNAEKISNLSPELKEANKVYSDLMDFQKNEGIRRILNNQNNIDTASSTLKNYNSTVSSGNKNRNIQDLENILVNNGYEPFLGNIDDVNAAMDFLENIKTGRNWLGATTFAKDLTQPVLKAVRAYNRSNLPNVITNIKETLSPLAQRLLTPLAVKASSPVIRGSLEYNDYR